MGAHLGLSKVHSDPYKGTDIAPTKREVFSAI
jgi:hypothetical protein